MSSNYRLLPATQTQPTKTQLFNIKFNQDLHAQLVKSSTSANTKLRLIVRNGELSIQLNNEQAYKLQSLPESSRIDIYKKFSSSTYKNIGTVHSKLVTTSPVSSPNISTETSTTTTTANTTASKQRSQTPVQQGKKTSPPPGTGSNGKSRIQILTRKVINPLAYGPMKLEDIISRHRLTEDEAKQILQKVAMPYDPQNQAIKKYPIEKNIDPAQKYYVLNYASYKDLLFDRKKLTPEEMDKLKRNSVLAFDHLKYPAKHPAREALSSRSPTLPSTPPSIPTSNAASINSDSISTSTPAPKPVTAPAKTLAVSVSDPVSASASTSVAAPSSLSKPKAGGLDGLKLPTGPKARTLSNERNTEIKSSSSDVKSQSIELKQQSSSSNSNTKSSVDTSNPYSRAAQKRRQQEPSPPPNYSDHSSHSSISSSSSSSSAPSSNKSSISSSSSVSSVSSTLIEQKVDKKSIVERKSEVKVEKKSFEPILEQKRKHSSDDDYLEDLAQRFRSKYKEYEKLYKVLTASQKKDLNEVKKLHDLHKSLESWKKQLWGSVATE